LQRRQTLYAYPHFLGYSLQRTVGFSDYNAMQVTLDRKFAQGLQLNAHYTWSKATQFSNSEAQSNGFDDGAGTFNFDLVDFRNNKWIATSDIPHRFVTSYVYELPFGRGQMFDTGNPVLRAVLGGWRTGGSVTLQTGTPDNVAGVANGSLNGQGKRLEGVPIEVPKELQRWYDGRTTVTLPSGRRITPGAFTFLRYSSDAFQGQTVTAANGTLQRDVFWRGNTPTHLDEIRNPNVYLWNASVQRTFSFGERYGLEFAAYFMNALNTPIFFNTSGGLGNTEIRNDPARGILPGYGDNPNFGTYGTPTLDPRQVEFALKFRF
ncbi:MAG: hypothetical protein M3R15_15310, partial [Acidobacteriota bacterium]|nr:hypothetical protein [Acidobacteriota bacterium]